MKVGKSYSNRLTWFFGIRRQQGTLLQCGNNGCRIIVLSGLFCLKALEAMYSDSMILTAAKRKLDSLIPEG